MLPLLLELVHHFRGQFAGRRVSGEFVGGREEDPSSVRATMRKQELGKPVAVMPSGFDLAPKGASEGLLIMGDGSKSPIPAPSADGRVRQLQIKPERNVP